MGSAIYEHHRCDQSDGERVCGRRLGAVASADGDDDALRRATSAIDPAKVDSTITNFRTASANLASMSAELKETTGKLDAILAKVDSGPGSAAKLLNDPGIYNDTRALLQQIESLVADIKRESEALHKREGLLTQRAGRTAPKKSRRDFSRRLFRTIQRCWF